MPRKLAKKLGKTRKNPVKLGKPRWNLRKPKENPVNALRIDTKKKNSKGWRQGGTETAAIKKKHRKNKKANDETKPTTSRGVENDKKKKAQQTKRNKVGSQQSDQNGSSAPIAEREKERNNFGFRLLVWFVSFFLSASRCGPFFFFFFPFFSFFLRSSSAGIRSLRHGPPKRLNLHHVFTREDIVAVSPFRLATTPPCPSHSTHRRFPP